MHIKNWITVITFSILHGTNMVSIFFLYGAIASMIVNSFGFVGLENLTTGLIAMFCVWFTIDTLVLNKPINKFQFLLITGFAGWLVADGYIFTYVLLTSLAIINWGVVCEKKK